MYWRRASVQEGQAFISSWWWRHCPGTAFPRYLRYFSSYIKKNSILESVRKFSTSVYMQIFNFRDCHVTIFGTLQEPISAKYLVTDSPDLQKAHLQSLAFHRYHWFGVKLLLVGCARDLKHEKCWFGIWPHPRYKIPDFFHDSTRPHLHFDVVCGAETRPGWTCIYQPGQDRGAEDFLEAARHQAPRARRRRNPYIDLAQESSMVLTCWVIESWLEMITPSALVLLARSVLYRGGWVSAWIPRRPQA